METQIKTRIKPWGNSLGIVIPREVIIKEELHPNEEITITINKEENLSRLFGKGKDLKVDSQKMKNEGRKLWKMD